MRRTSCSLAPRALVWIVPLLLVLALPLTPAGALDLTAILKTGKLRVLAVIEEGAPEFIGLGAPSAKNAAATGFDHEILSSFAKTQSLDLVYVPVPRWNLLMPALIEERGDVIAGRFSETPARRAKIDFTDEVFPTRAVVVNRKPNPPISSMEQLKLHKLGAVAGTSLFDQLVAAGIPASTITPVDVDNVRAAFDSGRVTAVLWSIEGFPSLQRKDSSFQSGLLVGPSASLAYGVRKDCPRLKAALDDHIRLVRQTGMWNRWVVRYFGDEAGRILKQARPD